MAGDTERPAPVVGLLYPGFGAEDDFPALEQRMAGRLRLPLVHTSVGEDLHEVCALLDLGGADRLAEGARTLLLQHPDSVMWACASGSFVFGWDGARRQVDDVAKLVGLPVSSTAIAFVEALRALGLDKVAVAASYPAAVAQHFVEFLSHGGITVCWLGSHDITTAAAVGRLAKDDVVALVTAADRSESQAVLVPDTAMHTLDQLEALENAAGQPVLTANHVTVWEGLRLLGQVPHLPEMGDLFR